ncbi:MAG TPA: DMT family transporter [Desulfobacteraceae bacterium]|nr:DMT family transporter [Desulfobacteraceae bacterium]
MPPERFSLWLVLFVGVCSVSTGAVFARLAEASPIVVAAYRTGLAFLVLALPAWVWAGREIASLSRSDFTVAAFSGFFLACHFAAWIASLDYTSIACSVVLVNTNPLWVAVLAPFVTGETIGRAKAAGIGVSILGAVFIGAGDLGGGRALFGDALAAAGGVAMACYLLLGARLRRKLSLLAYVTLCYGTAAAILWAVVLGAGLTFIGLKPQTYAAVVSLAFVSQLIGHSCYNWSLKWLSTSMVAVTLMGEPVFGTILGYLIFGEALTLWKAAGGVLILAGIYTASVSEKPPHAVSR